MLGGELEIEPTDALLAVVHREAGRLVWLRAQFELLEPGEDPTDGGSRAAVLARLEAQCCERLAKFSKAALDAGVAERRIRMAERQAKALAAAFNAALDAHPLGQEMTRSSRAHLVKLFTANLLELESVPLDGTPSDAPEWLPSPPEQRHEPPHPRR